jgi:hypothetical protein
MPTVSPGKPTKPYPVPTLSFKVTEVFRSPAPGVVFGVQMVSQRDGRHGQRSWGMAHSRAGWPVLIGWLTALIAPPVVAGTVWQRFAADHLVLAIMVGLAYWIVVVVAGFAGGVAGSLAGRWRERLADHLDLAIRRRVSRFEIRYRKLVLASLRFIDLKGLATVGPFTPELDAVFVDVSLVSRPPHEITPGVLDDLAPGVGRRALEEFIGRPAPVVLAVVGGPGSGKTTLLRYTARQTCLPERSRRGPGRDLPILLYLRDHVTAITADPAAASLAALLRSTLGDLASAEPPGWLEQKLRSGACIVLLDGLDEVARQEDRAKVAAWAERQIRSYPGNDFLITSRPHGYRTAPVEGAEVVQVCGFTNAQVDRFVRGWYRAVERHSTGAEGQDIDVRARAGADDLLRRLGQAPALRELTVNPLLLTMIANVHRYRGALPGSRAELYSEICQVMLWRRQEVKNLAGEMSGEKKETVLRALAYTMMQRRVSDLGRQDILDEVRPVLRRLSKRVTAEDLLADVGTNGLLIERETEQYSFAHHTFQEYLAAAHIRDKGLVNVLADGVSDPWWRETTLLYAARADADPVVKACLDAATVTALALAFDCVDQDSEFDADLRDHLDKLLVSGSAPDTEPGRRRLIAGVLLTRHLRPQVTATDGTRVCVHPISADLYGLFRADTLTPSPDTPPYDGATGTAVGMRGSDAAAFVRWANAVTGGDTTYRLPGRAMLSDPTVLGSVSAGLPDTGDPVVWVTQSRESSGALPGLWMLPDRPHPWEVDAETLAACVGNDIVQSLPIQFRLLVLRSLVATNALANHLRLIRTLSLTHIPDLSLDRAFHLALDLAHDLDRDPDLGLDRALDRARDLTRTLERACSLIPNRHRAYDPDLGRALDRAYDLARDLSRGLDRAYDLDRVRSRGHAFARVLVRALDLGFGLNRARVLDLARGQAADYSHVLAVGSAAVMGRSLSRALEAALRINGGASSWADMFTRALAAQVGIGDGSYLPAPHTLADKLTRAMKALGQVLAPQDAEAMPSWAITVAVYLAETAGPVFDRRECPAPTVATGIRLAALCLAGEADGLDRSEVGDMFREIAAGITLLELRYTDQRPATEVILLAID